MRTAILLGTAIACFCAAGYQNASLVDRRANMSGSTHEMLENAPPSIVITTLVFGGFRGMAVDALWLRLTFLQEQGKYMEVVQLSDWISKLDPYSGKVWVFHAWNMAYNVSMVMPTAEGRWRWVRHGISLLRDEGLHYNPTDQKLYEELSWIFRNKVGGWGHGFNAYYRSRWKEEMTNLFGGAHPDYVRIETDPVLMSRIKNQYKLDITLMRNIDKELGPLDWRRPEAHAIYWARCGLQHADEGGRARLNRTIRYCRERLKVLAEADAGSPVRAK